jgi:3-phenylpropionate/cinnamic acid dioxygenase small subunit
VAVDPAVQHEIEQFLYYEAELLDERRFHEWLDLFTEDTHYWMPIRLTVGAAQSSDEWTREYENSYFDDDKPMLEQRVEKLDTGYSWAEDPPSRTRHMVSNVQIREGERNFEWAVKCSFVVYRNRLATDEDWYVGRREDLLRKVDGRWRIAGRKIFLDQATLKSKNLSNFF